MNSSGLQDATKSLLVHLGEDLNRPGLLQTPEKFARLLADRLYAYTQEPPAVTTIDEPGASGEIALEDISFISFCEHHLVPFFGHVNVYYTPKNGRVTGFGTIARVCAHFAAKLQIQERMTAEIGQYLAEHLEPLSLRIECRARHMCMELHGAQKENVGVKTHFLHPQKQD
jgi:GTP cyclohydrolase I